MTGAFLLFSVCPVTVGAEKIDKRIIRLKKFTRFFIDTDYVNPKYRLYFFNQSTIYLIILLNAVTICISPVYGRTFYHLQSLP